MNILHLTYSLSAGGRRNAIVALSHGLKQYSINSYAASLINDDKSEIINSDDLSILNDILFLDKQKSYVLKSKRVASEIYDFCEKNNISAVHTHDAASQIIISIINFRYKRIPHVHTFHRSLEMDTAGIKNKIRNLYANLYTDIITVGSTERRKHYTNNNFFVSQKVVVIPFGIDVKKFDRKDEDNFELRKRYKIAQDTVVLGAVGHFRKEKGLDNILRAYAHFLTNNINHNTSLVIVGTGSTEQINYLSELANKLDIKENVHFVGHDADVVKWYSLFDIYLHAARKEAFGLVLIEAMATKLPVIASNVGGIPDIVLHNETGFLVTPEDHAEFSGYIAKLSSDSQMRVQFGKHANEIALKKYSTSEYANNYVAIYKSLIKSKE